MRAAVIGLALWSLSLGWGVALAQRPDAPDGAPPPVASRGGPTGVSGDSPVVTPKTNFVIPFTVRPSGPVPAELQLHISADRGASWQLYDRALPSAGQFAFRATKDGEYWFALRTIELDGRPNPVSLPSRPGLRVVIDTAEPRMEFLASVSPTGTVTTSWRIQDPTLDARTFKIEYCEGVAGPWKPVAIPRQVESAQTLSGEVTWRPETASRVIHVRAEVNDQAANRAVENQRLFLPRNDSQQPATPASTAKNASVPPTAPEGRASQQAIPWSVESPSQKPSPPPAAVVVAQPTGSIPAALSATGQGPAGQEATRNGDPPNSVVNPYYVGLQQLTGLKAYPAVEGNVQPPVGQAVSASQDNAAPEIADSAASPVNGLPPGERPRMARTTQFMLEYDIDSVGQAGIAEVQLWATPDFGRTWKMWQTDADKQSPLDITVPQEGTYGFRIVIVGNNGLAGRAPASGDLADLWVGVDTTKPVLRLTSAMYGEGQYAGNLDIRWEARDSSFAERPISLMFSEQPDGPWSTIASGLPNTGQHFWLVEARIPDKIFLRIEAIDEAGNTSEHQLTDPISTTGLVPQARIRGIRSSPTVPESTSLWRRLR